MERNCCLFCNRGINACQRDPVVRRIVGQMAESSSYPAMFTLLHQLELCTACVEQLPLISEKICLVCGREMHQQEGRQCPDCTEVHEHNIINRSSMLYNGWAKKIISRFKYRGDERLSHFFTSLLAFSYFRYYKQNDIQLITYVPLHSERLQERGFNQAEVLAVSLSHKLNIPVKSLIRRTKNTVKLSKQSGKKARIISMENAFEPMEALDNKASGTLLIIDDIYTTGSTMRACATAIRQIPGFRNANIYGLTISR